MDWCNVMKPGVAIQLKILKTSPNQTSANFSVRNNLVYTTALVICYGVMHGVYMKECTVGISNC